MVSLLNLRPFLPDQTLVLYDMISGPSANSLPATAMVYGHGLLHFYVQLPSQCPICKIRIERPSVGGVSARIRDAAPPRKGMLANGHMTDVCNGWFSSVIGAHEPAQTSSVKYWYVHASSPFCTTKRLFL